MPRRILVVINELGGRRFARRVDRVCAEVLGYERIPHHIVSTPSMREISAAVSEAVADGFTEIACVGGDGTVGMVANQIAGSDVVLSIIPGGTGNVLAKHLGIPLLLRAALWVLVASRKVIGLDCIERDDRLHVLNVSMGLSSLAMTDVDGKMKRLYGVAAYFFGVLGHLVRRGPVRFRIVADGRVLRRRGREALLTNAGFRGTALAPLFAGSSPSDGKLELSLFHLSGGRGLLGMVYDIATSSTRYRERYLERISVRHTLELSSDPPLPVQADGDGVGHGSVGVRVRPNALLVRVPDPASSVLGWARRELERLGIGVVGEAGSRR